ncbi:unnamed protein product [Brassica rapa subsp. narinosa]
MSMSKPYKDGESMVLKVSFHSTLEKAQSQQSQCHETKESNS